MGVLCVAFGVAFGVDAWRGRGELLMCCSKAYC